MKPTTFSFNDIYKHDDNYLKQILDYVVLNTNITYTINHSPKNPKLSTYIRLYKEEYSVPLRLSNHHTRLTEEGGGIDTLILDENVKTIVIYEKLMRKVRDLNYKVKCNRLNNLFKSIEGDKNNDSYTLQ